MFYLCSLTGDCPKIIQISADTSTNNDDSGDWKEKLGVYILKNYDNLGNAVYESKTPRGTFLHRVSGAWMVRLFIHI